MSGKHLCKLTEISGLLWSLARSGDEQSERLAKYLDSHIANMERRDRKKRSRFVYLPNTVISGSPPSPLLDGSPHNQEKPEKDQ